MSYNHVNVSLTPGQIKKLQSKGSLANGVTITLKPAQMNSGSNKLSLTATQLNHFNKAKSAGRGVRLKLSKAAISDMVKTGGFLPLIPILGALATGALTGAAGWGTKKLLDKVAGSGIRRRKRGSGFSSEQAAVMAPALLRMMAPTLLKPSFITDAIQALNKNGRGLRLPGSRYTRTYP